AGVLLGGCTKEDSGEGTAPAVLHRYTTRGRIAMLPDLTNPTSELRIHHEAIDDFRHGDGSPAPMKSMTMPFPPGPGVSLDGLAIGDVVEFTFEVQWEPTPGMSVTAIRKLPDDTELQFDMASQDSGEHGDHRVANVSIGLYQREIGSPARKLTLLWPGVAVCARKIVHRPATQA
ncbi:MAG: copper-binding protein, partial [Chloroflexi bacterium]|nr:copper-binding protein [Chloroflexota bacterium]